MSRKCFLFVMAVVLVGNTQLEAGIFKKLLATSLRILVKPSYIPKEYSKEELKIVSDYCKYTGIKYLAVAALAEQGKVANRDLSNSEINALKQSVEKDEVFLIDDAFGILIAQNPKLGAALLSFVGGEKEKKIYTEARAMFEQRKKEANKNNLYYCNDSC
jgi:hypothetical protein